MYGQPSSQMEIMTLAFVVEAFAIYLLLLRRPKGVSTHTYLPAARAPTSQEDLLRIGRTYPHYHGGSKGGTGVARFHYAIPNGTLHADPADLPRAGWVINIGIGVGAAVFGAMHLAAWNFDFPTLIEKQLWRAAALVMTVVFPLGMLRGRAGEKRSSRRRPKFRPGPTAFCHLFHSRGPNKIRLRPFPRDELSI